MYMVRVRTQKFNPWNRSQIKNKKKYKSKNIYNKRDYIFIDDVISAIKISLLSRNTYGIFNVSSGRSLSVKKIFEIIKNLRKAKPV